MRAEVGIPLVIGKDDDEVRTVGRREGNRHSDDQGQCQQMLSHGEESARSKRRSGIPGEILFPLRAVHVVGIEALDVAVGEQRKRLATVARIRPATCGGALRHP